MKEKHKIWSGGKHLHLVLQGDNEPEDNEPVLTYLERISYQHSCTQNRRKGT